MKTTVDYITKLANIPSPTGYTSHIMNYVIAELESFGYAPVRTNKGGVMVTVTGKDDSKHRVVTAHLDTLGAMVRAVKPDGRLKMDLIGGFVYNAIEGENCTIHVAKNGKKISGTILMHQTSVHVYKDAGTAERNQANMEIRLDEKVTNEKETRALGIEVGDFISFDPRVVVTESSNHVTWMTKYQQPFSLNYSKNTKLKISLCHTQLTSTSQLSKNSVTVLTQAFQLQQSNTFQLIWEQWVMTNKQMNTAFQSASKTVLGLITSNFANILLP